jgi:uncharacterized protein YbjT (DUF2867 family)
MRVLVVGGTGYLGSRIAREVAGAGHDLVALVRPGTGADALATLGATIVRGDLTDPRTLSPALDGIDAVVTTAIGYVARRPGDDLDTVDHRGNRHLADAARAAGIARLVFMSVLTADRAASVPHFHQKYRSEQYFERVGVPMVALRPGGFLDQVLGWSRAAIAAGVLPTMIPPDVPLTLVHADDVARTAVAALTAPGIEGDRIDLGMHQPATFRQVARELASAMDRAVALHYVGPTRAPGLEDGSPEPEAPAEELDASIAYMGSGRYVADVTRQTEVFGPPATLADAVRRWVAASDLAPAMPLVASTGV